MVAVLRPIILCLFLSGLGAGQTFQSHRDRVFARRGKRELKLNLFVPGRRAERPRPAVMVIPGGGWIRGGPESRAARFFTARLVREGYVVAAISYRHAPRHPWPAQILDCAEAIQWLRHHAEKYGIDSKRIGVIGASAGGHLGALMGTVPDAGRPQSRELVKRHSTRPRCVVAYSSPMVFDMSAESSMRGRFLVEMFLVGLKNTRIKEVQALLQRRAREASPLHHLSKTSVPLLMVHGTKDKLVPYEQSKRMAAAMKGLGIDHELIPVNGAGHLWYLYAHSSSRSTTIPTWWKRTMVFLEKHLRRRVPAPK